LFSWIFGRFRVFLIEVCPCGLLARFSSTATAQRKYGPGFWPPFLNCPGRCKIYFLLYTSLSFGPQFFLATGPGITSDSFFSCLPAHWISKVSPLFLGFGAKWEGTRQEVLSPPSFFFSFLFCRRLNRARGFIILIFPFFGKISVFDVRFPLFFWATPRQGQRRNVFLLSPPPLLL